MIIYKAYSYDKMRSILCALKTKKIKKGELNKV